MATELADDKVAAIDAIDATFTGLKFALRIAN